jgi:hypothetical protein
MNIIKYPSAQAVDEAIRSHEPLLALISFDGGTMLISHVDEAVEHHILLAKAGFSSSDIDKYFRIVLDDDGADWTFICPADYKNIFDKTRRISEFYKDGFNVISSALLEIGMPVGINIPKRYRRHLIDND